MKNVLIVDVETTGLDPTKDAVIEVGAILYSIEYATVLECFSSLLRSEANPAENINRIPAAALPVAPDPQVVWTRLDVLRNQAYVVVAHNSDFDSAFVEKVAPSSMLWVCSQNDIEWPRKSRPNPTLVSLALEHDLGVAYAHRALADCDLIARLFTRSRELGVDLSAMMGRAMRPKGTFVSLAPFEEKDVVKANGFQWFPNEKVWRRKMFLEDAEKLPFRTRRTG